MLSEAEIAAQRAACRALLCTANPSLCRLAMAARGCCTGGQTASLSTSNRYSDVGSSRPDFQGTAGPTYQQPTQGYCLGVGHDAPALKAYQGLRQVWESGCIYRRLRMPQPGATHKGAELDCAE